jgi:hypothetical protein
MSSRAIGGERIIELGKARFGGDRIELQRRSALTREVALDQRTALRDGFSSCCALNHCRTFVRARWLCT